MKPAMWYLMMLVVGFFYVYLTAIQILGDRRYTNPPPTTSFSMTLSTSTTASSTPPLHSTSATTITLP
ncbi:hypothetical protein Pcinc_030548 [Petrolisthes cinctipes]|uniref:Uncharacterized protein n=1 Tax=Petrolisthes cinctipes TaxID=88211 RepID=A0AAE1K667_PETCI|nr:hypothetical protein Pcinc_030548 [Petrolisthes cinctipes]